MDSIDKVMELAVAEPDFRKELLRDPAAALKNRGITLDPEQIAVLQSIADRDISVISDELSDRLAKVSEVERSY
jgi:hypothetical protein